MQKRTWLLPVLLSLSVVFSFPTMAQVSFFQAPAYSGSGNLFTADFNGDGKPDLLSGDGTLNLGNGNGTLIAKPKIGGTPVAVADFDADGRADVLELGTGTILVLLGNGDGTFQPAINTPSGADLSNVAVADMNSDGKPDVVGIFNSNLIVYLAKEDGTFRSGISTNFGFTSGQLQLTLGDFNGDNISDAVLSDTSCCTGQEIVFLGKGDGTFNAPKVSIGSSQLGPLTTVGDFNADTKLDLVVNNSLFLGNGDGTFQPHLTVFSLSSDVRPIAADVDSDGNLDLIFESTLSAKLPGSVTLCLGKGDGTFLCSNSYMTSEGTSSGAIVADFDLDGKLDVAADQRVLLGNGDGTFQGIPLTFVPPSGFNGAVIGDFDNNGTEDLAILSTTYYEYSRPYGLLTFSNNGTGVLSLIGSYILTSTTGYVESNDRPYAGAVINNIITADLNLDGTLDLIVLWKGTPSLGFSVLLGNGDSSFQSPISFPLDLGTPDLRNARLVVSDFNNDHRPDIAVTGEELIAILLGNGDGSFSSPLYYYYVGASAVVADFNQDGNVDIAGIGILFGNGDGTFQPLVFPASLANFGAQYSADLNNDGKPDLISGNGVALGNGDGTFTMLPDVLPKDRYFLGITDLNGDGNLDAVINNEFVFIVSPYQPGCMAIICDVEVMLGNGDGTFAVETSVLPIILGSLAPLQVLSSDMNNDGRNDLILTWGTIPFQVGGNAIGALTLLLNTTPPGFEVSASSVSPPGLMPGDSGKASVTVLADFGFTGNVALSCGNLPTGASCSFNPASVSNGSGRSAFTIATASSLAAGTYAVQVQGKSGSTVRGSVVTLDLSGFAISPDSESSQTIGAGQTASFRLDLTAIGSFAGTVNLRCAVAPIVTVAPVCSLSQYSVVVLYNTGLGVDATVTTTAPTATSVLPKVNFPGTLVPVACTVMMLGLVWFLLPRRQRPPLLATPILALAMTMCLSCGGSGSTSLPPSHSTSGTPPGTYTATITAASGSLSRSIPLQVTVQ